MVELKLDVAEDQLPSDCFISVRVGDAQKLSRVSPSRTYQFPQAGDRRYGKIEVYRRIGAIGVDVDPLNEGDRQVNISCGDLGALRLNVGVSNKERAKQAVKEENLKAKPEGSKSKAAKEYLRKHSLELQLSEAMQSVLREKPENPVQFLAEKLIENLQGGIALPASPKTPKAKKEAPAKAKAPTYSSAASTAATMTPFNEYYTENFVGASAPPNFYSKFGGPKKAAAAPAPAAAAPAEATPAFVFKPSVGTWLAKPVSVNLAVAEDKKPEVPAFVFKPSVGSWLAPKPPSPHEEEAPVPAAAPPAPKNFAMRPSVGTWLAKKSTGPKLSSAGKAGAKKMFVASSAVFGPGMKLGLAPRMVVF